MTISGILKPRSGSIMFFGKNFEHLPAHRIVSEGIVQVPEGRRIFPRLTVEENLLMGAFSQENDDFIKEDMKNVFELFPTLKERIKQAGGTLSGGEQQMLSIGRALMARPTLLLLDEPSLGLAPKLVEKIFEKIMEINKKGTTILLVEQNAHMALTIADRGYVLETGRIVLEGEAEALLHDPEVVTLDEPTSGLDPVNVVLVRTILKELKAQGRTILLSTHMMAEAEKLVDEIVDRTSKNGVTLLSIGPRADGTIPEYQIEMLRKLGGWMKVIPSFDDMMPTSSGS
jgi:branched-chain amino acid transport system ATP-binding protein